MEGSLTNLGPLSMKNIGHNKTLNVLMFHMLSALDYLAAQPKPLCHRDVKPDNILYRTRDGEYNFQLADFGLVNVQQDADTFCGTKVFMAPEMVQNHGQNICPKVDVWSLFVTLVSVIPEKSFNPGRWKTRPYPEIWAAIRREAECAQEWAYMAHEDPAQRASAAAMLVLANGEHGLTTPRNNVVFPPGVVDPRPVPAIVPPPVNPGMGPAALANRNARPEAKPRRRSGLLRKSSAPNILPCREEPKALPFAAPEPWTVPDLPPLDPLAPRTRKKPGHGCPINCGGKPNCIWCPNKPNHFWCTIGCGGKPGCTFCPTPTPQRPKTANAVRPSIVDGFLQDTLFRGVQHKDSLDLYPHKQPDETVPTLFDNQAPISGPDLNAPFDHYLPPTDYNAFFGNQADGLDLGPPLDPNPPNIAFDSPFGNKRVGIGLSGNPVDSIALHHRRIHKDQEKKHRDGRPPTPGYQHGLAGPPFRNQWLENNPEIPQSTKDYFRQTGFFGQGYLFGINAPKSRD